MSPALAGRFSTTVPPGKPKKKNFLIIYLFIYLAVSGLSCGMQALSCGVQAPEHMGSVVVARGFSHPTACGILVP